MIASHYAEPVGRVIRNPAELRASPSEQGEAIRELEPGNAFSMLDDSLGWAWGYAGTDRRVGYVKSDALRR